MNGFLLDTNVIIKFLQGNKEAIRILESIIDKDLFLSVITIAEYYQGSYRLKNPQDQIALLNSFIEKARVSILEISVDIAAKYGMLQGVYSSVGKTKPVFDLLLASTCIVYSITMVTFNKKHFEGIEELHLFEM